MTPEMRREFEILQADLIADYVLMMTSTEASDHKVRTAREWAESAGMVVIIMLGIVCVIAGLASIPSDLVMVIPNACMLAYRHLKGV